MSDHQTAGTEATKRRKLLQSHFDHLVEEGCTVDSPESRNLWSRLKSESEWGAIRWNNVNVTDAQFQYVRKVAFRALLSRTIGGMLLRKIVGLFKRTLTVLVENRDGEYDGRAMIGCHDIGEETTAEKIASVTVGVDVCVRIDPGDRKPYGDGTVASTDATFVHEAAGHGYYQLNGRNPVTHRGREVNASGIENEYRVVELGIAQRRVYGTGTRNYALPQYDVTANRFLLKGAPWKPKR